MNNEEFIDTEMGPQSTETSGPGFRRSDISAGKAPWTYTEITLLMMRQTRNDLHPYTCGVHSSCKLLPSKTGWTCPVPTCDYNQDWAHAADLGRD